MRLGKPSSRPVSGVANLPPRAHISGMAKTRYQHMLEVSVAAIAPTQWEWRVSEGGAVVMSGYETSRETAQIEGDSALFFLLSSGLK